MSSTHARAVSRTIITFPKRSLFAALIACVILSFVTSTAIARQTVPDPGGADEDVASPPTIQDGQTFLNQQKFAEAAHIFELVARAQPANGQAWFLLGYARHAQGKLDLAMSAHLTAAEIGQAQTRATAMYNIACVYSLKNNPDKAFAWLEEAFDNGFANNNNILSTDPDMDNIREDARFASYLKRITLSGPNNIPGPVAVVVEEEGDYEDEYESTTRPVSAEPINWSSKPVRRQFDFWVGEWDVVNTQGKTVGTNIITRREGGNIIHESWTSSDGSTGQSINYLDPADKKWKQVWVSEKGGVVYYAGNFTDGAMRYEGDNIKPDGTTVHTECTLTPLDDGRIHHFIRHTTDEGETWTTYFDAHYVRRNDSD